MTPVSKRSPPWMIILSGIKQSPNAAPLSWVLPRTLQTPVGAVAPSETEALALQAVKAVEHATIYDKARVQLQLVTSESITIRPGTLFSPIAWVAL